MYTAFRERRLAGLRNRGSNPEAGLRRLQQESDISKDLGMGSDGTMDVASLHALFTDVMMGTIVDIDIQLKRRAGIDAELPPMPDVLRVLGTLVSRPEWQYGHCKSLSLATDDLEMTENPLTDVDDADDLAESLLPRLFGFGLRHFELASPVLPAPPAKHDGDTAVSVLLSGLERGRHSLQCVALRRVGLGRDGRAMRSLLAFLWCNSTIRHLDLSGNGLDGPQRDLIRTAVNTRLSCLQTLIFDEGVEERGAGVHPLPAPVTGRIVTVTLPDYLDGRYTDVQIGAAANREGAQRFWMRHAVAFDGHAVVPWRTVPRSVGANLLLPPGPHEGKSALLASMREALVPRHESDVAAAAYPCHMHNLSAVSIGDAQMETLCRSGLYLLFGADTNDVTTDPETLALTHVWRRRISTDPLVEEQVLEANILAYRAVSHSVSVTVVQQFTVQMVAYHEPRASEQLGTTDGSCTVLFEPRPSSPPDQSPTDIIASAFSRVCRDATVDLHLLQK